MPKTWGKNAPRNAWKHGAKMHPEMCGNKYCSSFGQLWVYQSPHPPPGHASHLCTLYNCTWCLVWRRVQADLMCGKELEREAAEWRDLYLSKCGRRLPKIWGEDGSCGKMNLPHRQADVDIKYIKRIAALVVGIFLALTSYTRQTWDIERYLIIFQNWIMSGIKQMSGSGSGQVLLSCGETLKRQSLEREWMLQKQL